VKLRLASILGVLALTATATVVPASAAGTSTAANPSSPAAVLTPAQTGTSNPAQSDGWGYMSMDGTGMTPWATLQQASSDDQSTGSSSDDAGRMRRHHRRMWSGFGMPGGIGMLPPTGSPWPWWAGMPLWQISAMTGGTWPWAYGPPLFLAPPLPPLPPLGVTLFNVGLLSGRTCTPRLLVTICR